MTASRALSGLVLVLGLAACAGSPEGPLEPDRIQLTAMDVAVDPKIDVRYPVLLRYDVSGDVRIIDSCFTWVDDGSPDGWLGDASWFGDGPYCLAPEGGEPPGAVRTMLVSGHPGTYRLEVYVRYEGGGALRTSNTLSDDVTVTRRLPQL
jgi:hypothetical protein